MRIYMNKYCISIIVWLYMLCLFVEVLNGITSDVMWIYSICNWILTGVQFISQFTFKWTNQMFDLCLRTNSSSQV